MAEGRGLRLESVVTPESVVVLSLTEGEVRAPHPDEVVVRVEAAPINPSDLSLMFAFGDIERAEFTGTVDRPVVSVPLPSAAFAAVRARVGQPIPVGNEGAGTVVAVGDGELAQALEGRVVAVAGGGAYSQLRCLPASACTPLPDGAAATDGAASHINPMTALGMVETMRAEGHRALVHTAAASSLGRMLNRLCLEDGIPLVNVVRSSVQAEMLRSAGAEFVCDSSHEDFELGLTTAVQKTGATIAFDAIGGGTLIDAILTAMERALSDGGAYQVYGSEVVKRVYVYGSLDRSPSVLRRTYGMSWGVGGWLLPRFLEQAPPERLARMRRRLTAGFTTTFAAAFTDTVSLTGALTPEAIAAYGRPSTGVKFLVIPNS